MGASVMIKRVGARRITAFHAPKLAAVRSARGWTYGRVAAALDVSASTVAAWERGARAPEPPLFVALARAFDLEPAELLSIPPPEWGLAEFRVTRGYHQREAAELTGIRVDKLSGAESGYQRLDDDDVHALAALYEIETAEVREAWQRGRDRLLAD